MGWQATGWAFKAPIVNPGAKFVLVALAERAGNEDDEQDWTCYPSIETIAAYTAQGYRTIQRHLDWLEAQGYISRERRTTAKGRKGAYNFTLHRHPTPLDKMAGGQDVHGDRPNGAAKRVSNGRTEPVTGTDQGTAEARGTRVADGWVPDPNIAIIVGLSANEAADQLERFHDYWRGVPGAKGRKIDWPGTWRNWCKTALERSNGRREVTTTDHAQQRYDARAAATIAGIKEAADSGRRQRWRL